MKILTLLFLLLEAINGFAQSGADEPTFNRAEWQATALPASTLTVQLEKTPAAVEHIIHYMILNP